MKWVSAKERLPPKDKPGKYCVKVNGLPYSGAWNGSYFSLGKVFKKEDLFWLDESNIQQVFTREQVEHILMNYHCSTNYSNEQSPIAWLNTEYPPSI